MRTRTAAAAATLLAATLTACSGASGDADPVKTVTITAAPSPAPAAEDTTQACYDALYERAATAAGEVAFEPTPAPCAQLGDSEYLEAYMASLQAANEAALEERQRQRDEAEQQDQ